MSKAIFTKVIFLILITTGTLSSAAEIRYVSDDLTIPMRTGTTTQHKILKFLSSGMAVEILEQNEDNTYARVVLKEDPDKVGWVETRLLMNQPSARDRLVKIKAANDRLREQRGELRQQLDEMQQANDNLLKVQAELEQKIQGLQNSLGNLRSSAAEPIRIAEENQELKQQLATARSNNEELVQQNAFLADQNIKQWFMIGAAVSLGSLILGLLITRINWKKRNSWGGSF